MKLFPSIFLCVLFVALSACQKENAIADFNSFQGAEEYELSNAQEITNLDYLLIPVPEPNPFEIQLQWTSFITAVILLHHPDVANDINAVLNLNGNVIPVNDLLGWDVDNGDSFNSLFWTYMNLYYHPGRPNRDIIIPPVTGDDPVVLELIRGDVLEFMTTITEEECVELFFPQWLSLNETPLQFTSTAHPLTLVPSNYGYLHQLAVVNPSTSNVTNLKTVNEFYVSQNENIIVARPFRNVTNCLYDQYDGILFEEYLNN